MGDTGAVFSSKLNNNFVSVKMTFQEIDTILQTVATQMLSFLTAGQIKSLNIASNGLLQYSTDGINYTDCIQWGKIRGRITDQTDLKTLLDEKAPNVALAALQTLMTGMRADINTNTDSIDQNTSDIEQNTSDIQDITLDISSINNQIALRPLGNGIRQLRINGGQFQYSLSDPSVPNPTWHNIAAGEASSISWGNIVGQLSDQPDLNQALGAKAESTTVQQIQALVTQAQNDIAQINTLLGGYSPASIAQDLASHTSNTSNPHSVTQSQVGLGNVDNTSDINKPVSNPQQQAIDLAEQTALNAVTQVSNDLTTHTSNLSNPHSVTKAQIGLGNVDNTADADKPVSNPQKEALLQKITGQPNHKMFILSQGQYDDIIPQDNVIYIINPNISAEAISFNNAYYFINGKPYYNTFNIQATSQQIQNARMLSYVGNTVNCSFTYNDLPTIPSSGTVTVKCHITTADNFYSVSTLTLGTITII